TLARRRAQADRSRSPGSASSRSASAPAAAASERPAPASAFRELLIYSVARSPSDARGPGGFARGAAQLRLTMSDCIAQAILPPCAFAQPDFREATNHLASDPSRKQSTRGAPTDQGTTPPPTPRGRRSRGPFLRSRLAF